MNTIGESLTEHEYWHVNNITMLSGIRRVVWATWQCQGQERRERERESSSARTFVKVNDTRGHILLLFEAKEGLGYRASIRIWAGKLSASAPAPKKVLSTVGQIKQMSRIVCCYIRWSGPKLFDTKHVTNEQIVCDIISMKCKLARCSDDQNVQIHSTRTIPLCHFTLIAPPFILQNNNKEPMHRKFLQK